MTFWQPTDEDVEKAYANIHEVIANSKNPYDSLFPVLPGQNESDRARMIEDSKKFKEVPSILAGWRQYGVQFIGILVKGKKKILCNFVVCRNKEEERELSRYYNPGVPDSGTCVWRITYDVDAKTCSGFSTSGNA